MEKNVRVTIETSEGDRNVIECDGFLGTCIDHTPDGITDRYFNTFYAAISYLDGCRATTAMSVAIYDYFIKSKLEECAR